MSDTTFATSSGLASLMMLARLHGVDADQDQLRGQLGTDNIRLPEMVRAAKLLGFDASVTHSTWQLMVEAALPGIAALRTGEFLVVAKVADDKIFVQHPLAPKAQVLTRVEFEARWDGRLFLMSRQAVPQQSAVRLAAGSWSWEALHKSGPQVFPASQALAAGVAGAAGGTPATSNAPAGVAGAPSAVNQPENAERAANPQAANPDKAATRQETINAPAGTASPAT